MTSENNKKTESLKKSLNELLIKLEHEQQKIGTKKSYVYIGDKTVPVSGDKLELLDVATSLLSCLIENFFSVDDLSSVRKLRETEILFSNNYHLKKFIFQNYTSQIDPILLNYANLEIEIDTFDKKAKELLKRGHEKASKQAIWVVFLVRELIEYHFQEEKNNGFDYKTNALKAIDKAKLELEQHRGCKKILGNLLLLILTLGTAHIANKMVNKHFLFFRETDSSKKLKQLEHTISKLAP
jgi:hypothetical protein